MSPRTEADPGRLDAARWPASKIEMWQVSDLVPYVRNARTHPPEQIDQIAASMERFGFTIPMLVSEDGTIIAGHGRLMAAAQLGLSEVPVMVARGWSDEDRRIYTLADNRLAETSEWDPEMLRIEVDDLREQVGAADLAMFGFSDADLAEILPSAIAEMTGRRCHAVELNPVYVDVAVRRWQEFTGREAILEQSGETFAQTMAARLGDGPEGDAA